MDEVFKPDRLGELTKDNQGTTKHIVKAEHQPLFK